MRDKASPGTWLSWLTVSVGGAAMVGVFALAGGVGGTQRGVASAVAADTSSSSTATTSSGPEVSGFSLPACLANSLSGLVRVNDKLTGTVTVGLFAISDPTSPLMRSFTDTGQRATVTFHHSLTGQFSFTDVPPGAPGFLVAVIPASGTIDPNTQLAESQVIPTCNTVTTTQTTTTTATATTSTVVTFTFIHYVTVTNNVVYTVTQTTNPCNFAINPIGNAAHPTAAGAKLSPVVPGAFLC